MSEDAAEAKPDSLQQQDFAIQLTCGKTFARIFGEHGALMGGLRAIELTFSPWLYANELRKLES